MKFAVAAILVCMILATPAFVQVAQNLVSDFESTISRQARLVYLSDSGPIVEPNDPGSGGGGIGVHT